MVSLLVAYMISRFIVSLTSILFSKYNSIPMLTFAENSELTNDLQLRVSPKSGSKLLRRPTDLLEDNGGIRKTVALSTIGEKKVDMEANLDPNLSSDSIDRIECRPSNLAIHEGKPKGSSSKRKARDQPLRNAKDRVSTRAETRKK